jgi:hypothetical protein
MAKSKREDDNQREDDSKKLKITPQGLNEQPPAPQQQMVYQQPQQMNYQQPQQMNYQQPQQMNYQQPQQIAYQQDMTYLQPQQIAYQQDMTYLQPQQIAYQQNMTYLQPQQIAYQQDMTYLQPQQIAYQQDMTYLQPQQIAYQQHMTYLQPQQIVYQQQLMGYQPEQPGFLQLEPITFTKMIGQFERKYKHNSYIDLSLKIKYSLIKSSEVSEEINELAKLNDIAEIKKKFKTIHLYADRYRTIPNPKEGMYRATLESIFFVAVASNARETVNFLGLRKLRLLNDKPGSIWQKTLREGCEIYIYKDNNINKYFAGCKKDVNTNIEVVIQDIKIVSTLRTLKFQNQLYCFDSYFWPLFSQLTRSKADLPFTKDFKISSSIIEQAITSTFNNPATNIPLLWDLLESANALSEKPNSEFGGFKQQWSDDPELRDANAVCDIFIRAINNHDLDLMKFLSQSPFRNILEQKPEVFSYALKTLFNKEELTLDCFLYDFATSCKTSDLLDFYWRTYILARESHLNLFLKYDWLRDHMFGALNSGLEIGKFGSFLTTQKSINQISYLQSMLVNGYIQANYDLFLKLLDGFDEINKQQNFYNYTQQQWNLILGFMQNKTCNPNNDDFLNFAVKTTSPILLKQVLDMNKPRVYEEQWFNTLMTAYQEKNVRCVNTLLACYYNKSVYVSVLMYLAEDILRSKDKMKEKIFSYILQNDYDGKVVVQFFFEAIKKIPFKPYLQLLANHSDDFQILPIIKALSVQQLATEEILKTLIQMPQLFKKLTPLLWLDNLKPLKLDSYPLRIMICEQDTWQDFFKIYMLKSTYDEVPQDIWQLLWSIALYNKTHLIETDIRCTLSTKLQPLIQTIDIVLVDEEPALRFLDKKKQIVFQKISLTKAYRSLSFFKEYNVGLYECPALKQEIVDKVREANEQIPDIRTFVFKG